jgi:hypothetical protein
MKMNRFFSFLLGFFIVPVATYPQIQKIAGTYRGYENECIKIEKDSFKIMSGLLDSFLLGLDEDDEILARGKVEDMGNGFIKLTTLDYEWLAQKGTTVVKSYDEKIKDSLQINFDFPFKGEFKIKIGLGNGHNYLIYEFENTKNIILPMPQDSLKFFSDITIQKLNLNPILSVNYMGLLVFRFYPGFDLQDKNINSFNISIPALTNSYFGRYFIDGEYVLIDKYHTLLWRNRKYEKEF